MTHTRLRLDSDLLFSIYHKFLCIYMIINYGIKTSIDTVQYIYTYVFVYSQQLQDYQKNACQKVRSNSLNTQLMVLERKPEQNPTMLF